MASKKKRESLTVKPNSNPDNELQSLAEFATSGLDKNLADDIIAGINARRDEESESGSDYSDYGREPRQVRCGLFFRRSADEDGGNICLPGGKDRSGLFVAYCGDDDKGSDPNRWAATIVLYHGVKWDKKNHRYLDPSITTVQAFRLHCDKCGDILLPAGEIRHVAPKLVEVPKKGTVIDWLCCLGDVCPKCGGPGLKSWGQLDPLGEDGARIYGSAQIEWIKSKVLSATGDLNVPPVVAYVENGEPGSQERLPACTMHREMDRLCELAAEKRLQVVNYDDLNRNDEVGGIDLVCPDIALGVVDADELNAGIRSDKECRYRIDLKIFLKAALSGRKYALPSIDDPYPGKPKEGRKNSRRPKGGWHF